MKSRIVVGLVIIFALCAMLLVIGGNRTDASGSTIENDQKVDTGIDVLTYGNAEKNFSLIKEDEDMTPDEHLVEIAKQFPEFGGLFYDQDGTLQVYMVGQKEAMNSSTSDFLKSMISSEILGGESLDKTGMEVIEGNYTFLQLKEWHDKMTTSVLEMPGVVFTDIDDTKNRLRIGVENLRASRKTVTEHLVNLGIPIEAVVISRTKPIEPELRDRNRPLRGGFQINFSGSLCTLGFVADRGGVRGFVTNSHCSGIQGGNQGTVFHQPTASGTTNRIGQETTDPTYFTGGACPAGRRCRFSDSSFARVPHPSGPSVSSTRGSIARPPVGSTSWNGTDLFTITSESNPVAGQSVTKVGRTTGRSSGTVQQTCANFNVSGGNITQLCQAQAGYNSAGGDSGSPVFRITSGFNVALVGIHWGSGGAFSPIGGIQRSGELGAITTCSGGAC
ncbi:MAG: S1 family peptidase [Pyrinomonadaceae bacterium]